MFHRVERKHDFLRRVNLDSLRRRDWVALFGSLDVSSLSAYGIVVANAGVFRLVFCSSEYGLVEVLRFVKNPFGRPTDERIKESRTFLELTRSARRFEESV